MTTNTVVVVQPSYVPWRGYFDLIRRADTFIFYEDVQFDKHGWRNRNRIKTASGLQWLTIPVIAKGNVSSGLPINEVAIDERTQWRRKHLESLRHAYRRAPFFDATMSLFEGFLAEPAHRLVDVTIPSTIGIANHLDLHPRWLRSSEFTLAGNKLDRLLDLLVKAQATKYISGPSARAYIDEASFAECGIELEFIEYRYADYPQLHGSFESAVSILDLLMMTGPRAKDLILPNPRETSI